MAKDSERGWTDRERTLLVECAVHMQEVTGHDIGECTRELRDLVTEYRKAKGSE